MIGRLRVLAVAAALVGTAADAQAPGSASADVECFGALSLMINADDPTVAQAAIVGVAYYLGKLEARGIDFAAELEARMRAATPERLGETRVRCGNEIKAAGERMQAIGADMAMRDPPLD